MPDFLNSLSEAVDIDMMEGSDTLEIKSSAFFDHSMSCVFSSKESVALLAIYVRLGSSFFLSLESAE